MVQFMVFNFNMFSNQRKEKQITAIILLPKTIRMNTLKNVFLLLFAFLSIAASAQIDYDIKKITVDEKFDARNRLIARTIRSTGTQGAESLRVELVVNPTNKVKSLMVNDKKINPLMIKEYSLLTDYVINYADTDRELEKPKGNAVVNVVGQNLQEKLTENDERILLRTIKNKLLSDSIIKVDNEPFDFSLTGYYLFINGKKQEAHIFQKYTEVYKGLCKIPLSKTTYFQITQTL